MISKINEQIKGSFILSLIQLILTQSDWTNKGSKNIKAVSPLSTEHKTPALHNCNEGA
jgi:hypothetical protein